jgi:protein required for attachment to host cells
MSTCLLVADASRARLFTIEPTDDWPDPGVALRERADYIRPERRHPAGAALTDHPGTAYAPTGLAFGLDDHRAARTRQIDRGFAADLAAELARAVADTGTEHTIVVASPRMLGALRPLVHAALGSGVVIDEIALDLTKLSVARLHDRLAAMGFVPARRRRARAS